MPTVYIKVEHDKCEIINFKDVTIIVDLKERINYISFDIKNTEEQNIQCIEIVVPYKDEQFISNAPEANTTTCDHSKAYGKFTKLLLKMDSPLKKGDIFHVKIGFKVVLEKPEKQLALLYYNLLPPIIESIGNSKILNVPPICTETMALYIFLPKSLKVIHASSPPAEFYPRGDSEISDIESELRVFLKERGFFKKDKIFNEKRFDKIFRWTRRQLRDLPEKLEPDSKGRAVHFYFDVFRKTDNVSIFGIKISLMAIISLLLAIISLIQNH